MSFFKNKPILTAVAVIVIAVIVAAVSKFSGGVPLQVAGGVTSSTENIFSKLFSPLLKIGDRFTDIDKLRDENEQLKAEIDELLKENRGAQEYITENKRLKELLGIKKEMVDKEVISALVIAYDWDNFSETVTINRGSNDGIEKEDAVVSSLGIIGRVTELGKDWARVTTLLSPKHSLGVRITRTGDLAVAEGDVKLAKEKKLRLNYISGASELIEGDIIETSGIGGVYPPELMVGKVSEIKKDNSGSVSYAIVEPTADFTRLAEVLVITDWSRQSAEPEYVLDTNDDEDTEPLSEITDEEIQNAEG